MFGFLINKTLEDSIDVGCPKTGIKFERSVPFGLRARLMMYEFTRGNNMISRKVAMVNSLKTYDDCEPCFRGHPPCRYTKTGKCVYCHRLKSKKNRMSLSTKNAVCHKYGLTPIKVFVHFDDIETLESFCAALRLDRNIPVEIVD